MSKWTPPNVVRWKAIVDAHAELWRNTADKVARLDRGAWDILICSLEHAGGFTLIFPARCLAPFKIPQTPDDGHCTHFEELTEDGCLLATTDLDPYEVECEDDEFDALVSATSTFRVAALQESLAQLDVESSLSRLGEPSSFGIHWAPQTDSGYFVHMNHMRGPRLPPPMRATTAYAALAPLFWHTESYVGRNHSGLVFEGNELVAATLSGPDVTDATLGLLDEDRASCCRNLRSLTLAGTRTSPDAVQRIRALLPETDVQQR